MTFEDNLKIGAGVYTVPEISKILRLPYNKVHRWVRTYWEKEFGEVYTHEYSWEVAGSRAFNFHAFVEFYVMMEMSEAGVKPQKILKAHGELNEMYQTSFPFALKEVLGNIQTDGKTIYFNTGKGVVSLNGTKQFNLQFINLFFKKLDFDNNSLAKRFWPLGKDKSILMDPER